MSRVYFFVRWPADLEVRERQAEAEAQKTEEFKITRTLEEEVRIEFWNEKKVAILMLFQ